MVGATSTSRTGASLAAGTDAAREVDDERHRDRALVDEEAVRALAVLAQALAVVGREHGQHGARGRSRAARRRPERAVDVRDLRRRRRRAARSRRSAGRLVRIVRVVVVDPGEPRLGAPRAIQAARPPRSSRRAALAPVRRPVGQRVVVAREAAVERRTRARSGKPLTNARRRVARARRSVSASVTGPAGSGWPLSRTPWRRGTRPGQDRGVRGQRERRGRHGAGKRKPSRGQAVDRGRGVASRDPAERVGPQRVDGDQQDVRPRGAAAGTRAPARARAGALTLQFNHTPMAAPLSPSLARPASASVLAAARGPSRRRTETRRARSVVLITLDTTRADALGCYGGRAADARARRARRARAALHAARSPPRRSPCPRTRRS